MKLLSPTTTSPWRLAHCAGAIFAGALSADSTRACTLTPMFLAATRIRPTCSRRTLQRTVGQILHGHAQRAGPLPDEAALAAHDAALAVDDPLAGDFSQDRRDLLPHLRRPLPAPVRNLRQVSRRHAHPGRELLHGEPPPPCRRPQLALSRPRRLGSGCHRCCRHHDLLLCCVASGLRPPAGKEEGPSPTNGSGPCEWGCVVRAGGPAVSGDGPR